MAITVVLAGLFCTAFSRKLGLAVARAVVAHAIARANAAAIGAHGAAGGSTVAACPPRQALAFARNAKAIP